MTETVEMTETVQMTEMVQMTVTGRVKVRETVMEREGDADLLFVESEKPFLVIGYEKKMDEDETLEERF